MKRRYTLKELQSIVIEPSRQQERQKIVKEKGNIDREIVHRPVRRYLSRGCVLCEGLDDVGEIGGVG